MRLPPARPTAGRKSPSTEAGTPLNIVAGAPPPGHCLRTESWLPPIPPLVTTTAAAAASKLPAGRREDLSPRPAPLASSSSPRTPLTRPAVFIELGGAVPEMEGHASGGFALAEFGQEGRHQGRSRAPRDVEARDRVAVAVRAVAAAFGPLHQGKQPDAQRGEPGTLLPGGEVHVRRRPLLRQRVLRPVESGGRMPVGEGQLFAVPHPEPPLFRGVDQEEAAEGPVRLAADGGLGFLIEHRHPPAGGIGLGRRHEPGQAGADHHDIGLDPARPAPHGRPFRHHHCWSWLHANSPRRSSAAGSQARAPQSHRQSQPQSQPAPARALVWSARPEPEN